MSDDARKRGRPEEKAADIGRAPTVAPSELPTATGGGHGAGEPVSRVLPDQIGGYKILGLLGEGGMGVVYEAEQPHPKRKVALKVVRGGAFVDDTRLRLFQREAETLARLKHPNIAAIYESGRTDDGEHFFAMELVQGPTLLDWLHARPRTVTPEDLRLRLFLFRQIAEAVHYAHQRGVIHRDLKPSNVIVSDETTSADLSTSGVRSPAVKILDFGLARITEGDMQATMTTEVGVIKGTLPYMSPEQARGRPEAIDVRTDVYALGVVLYEMLSGKLPYDVEKGGVPEALRAICEENPQPLSRIWSGAKRLDPDVETIIGKALEKDADRRYQSAAALAEDIDRYLMSKPIEARPPSTIYQLRKFARRNRVLVAGVAATIVALVAGIVVSEMQRREAVVQRQEAVQQRQQAEANLLFALGREEMEADPTRALAYAIASLEQVDAAQVRQFAQKVLWRGPNYFHLQWEGFENPATNVRFSPDGEWLAIGQNNGQTVLWRPDDGAPKFLGPELDRPTVNIPQGIVFSPHSDSLLIGLALSTAVQEWSVATREPTRSFVYDDVPGEGQKYHYPLHFSSDGSRLISIAQKPDGCECRLLSWSGNAEGPVVLGVFGDEYRKQGVDPAFDPEGRLIAYRTRDEIFLRSLEASAWGPARPIGGHEGVEVRALAFDHDGTRLASGDHGGGIRVWELPAGSDGPARVVDGGGSVANLAFAPDGSFLLSGHNGGRRYAWPLDTSAAIPPLELLHRDRDAVYDAAIHPSSRWIAASHGSGTVVWPIARTYPSVLVQDDERARDYYYRGFAFSPDGTWVAASLLRPLRRIPLAPSAGDEIVTLIEDIPRALAVAFDPSGRYLVAGGIPGGEVYVKSLQDGKLRRLPFSRRSTSAVAVSHDGRLIAASGANATDNFLRVWDVETWQHRDLPADGSIRDMEFTGDDELIFITWKGTLHRWNLKDEEAELLGDEFEGDFDLSPDGRYILGQDREPPGMAGVLKILDLQTNTTRYLKSHHTGGSWGTSWEFDPTGTLVISGGADGIVRVGPVSGEEPHLLIGHEASRVNQVAVSPDGKWILSAAGDGTLRLWPMPDLDQPPLQTLPHDELLERLRAQTNLRVNAADWRQSGYVVLWDDPNIESWDDPPTW